MTRLSTYFLPTEREPPADAEAISHKLMVRAGLIRQVGSGLWSWLPGRMARPREHRPDRARGDERDRRPGDADAGAPAGRAVAADGSLRDRRAVQAQGPPRRRHGAGADPRGDRHRARRCRGALVPRPAADPLPLPGQGARRAAPAGRRAADTRIHHEGLLHLRPRRRGARRRLPEARRGLRPDHGPLRARVVSGRGRRGDDGRLRRPRVHGAVPGGRERRGPGAGLRRQPRGGHGPGPARPAACRWSPEPVEVHTPG